MTNVIEALMQDIDDMRYTKKTLSRKKNFILQEVAYIQ